jgi:hypothetical protein
MMTFAESAESRERTKFRIPVTGRESNFPKPSMFMPIVKKMNVSGLLSV